MRTALRLRGTGVRPGVAHISKAALFVPLLWAPVDACAQVTVRDSLGAPVPFAIVEAPDGRRAIAGADGVATAVSPATGPWSARRIGYRPGKDHDGDGVIVLARMPVELATELVGARSECTVDRTAIRAGGPQVESVRALLQEAHDRRTIGGAAGQRVAYRLTTTLVAEDGRQLEGEDGVIEIPVQPSTQEYVPGRAVERVDGEWQLRRPRLADVAAPSFLGAHCLWIEAGTSDGTAVVRFAPAREVQGPNISGAFVVERATGRILSDTVVLESPPKGAPGAARFVTTYEDGTFRGDPIPVPRRVVETIRPADLNVRLEGKRIRIAETIRQFDRVSAGAGSPEP